MSAPITTTPARLTISLLGPMQVLLEGRQILLPRRGKPSGSGPVDLASPPTGREGVAGGNAVAGHGSEFRHWQPLTDLE